MSDSEADDVIDLVSEGNSSEENYAPSPPKKRAKTTTKKPAEAAAPSAASSQSTLMAAQLLAAPDAYFANQTKEQLLTSIALISNYARQLQATVFTGAVAKPPSMAQMDPKTLAYEVGQLRETIVRKVKKSMTWKASCKKATAIWRCEQVTKDEAIFRAMVKDPSAKWKRKAYTVEEFFALMGVDYISSSARYSSLHMTGNVTISWDAETRLIKFGGKYGVVI
jgi:hypothetical protein